jgi:DNA-binding response OmpR family regulator
MNLNSTVLIVDDEASVRDALGSLLADEGYSLAFASNGAEALARAAELAPDLILLDVRMPVMDGFEACKQLRATPLLAEVPVIMITAFADPDARLRGLKIGADDFISKPFDAAELQARVRTITRLDRYRRLHLERVQRQQAEASLQESEERYRYPLAACCLRLAYH